MATSQHAGQLTRKPNRHLSLLQEVIIRIRDARNQMNVEPARRVPVIMAAGNQAAILEAQASIIEFLARTEKPELHS